MTQKRQILLQNALALLCEVQRRASTLKDETGEEVKELMHKFSTQAKEGAVNLVSYWQENKSHLPQKMTQEVDRLLDRMGLAKKTVKTAKTAVKKKASTAKVTVKKAVTKKPAARKAAAKKPAIVSAAA